MLFFPAHKFIRSLPIMGLPAAGCLVFLAILMCPGTANAGSIVVPSISLAGSSEAWTDHWEIQDTLLKSDQGLKAGFYRLLPMNKGIRLADGARGIVCLFPDSRYKHAKMVRRNFSVTSQNLYLTAKVAASRIPPGRWECQLSINGSRAFAPIIINGSEGWQELTFDLSKFLNQSVDIELEVRAVGSGRDSSAFIDYIRIKNELKREQGTSTPSSRDGSNDSIIFDEEFNTFLDLWRRNEEIRQQRMMDRFYLDSLYNKTAPYKHKD